METLKYLAVIGLPTAGLLTLGVIWLTRSVFKDVNLSLKPHKDGRVARAEQRAEGLDLQLAIAEDLGIDAPTLNAIKDQADLAHDDSERARAAAQEQEAPATNPVPVPFRALSPVIALHSAHRDPIGEQDQ